MQERRVMEVVTSMRALFPQITECGCVEFFQGSIDAWWTFNHATRVCMGIFPMVIQAFDERIAHALEK
jgi:hypothetical protein